MNRKHIPHVGLLVSLLGCSDQRFTTNVDLTLQVIAITPYRRLRHAERRVPHDR